MGLDRANQIDPAQQISRCAQIHEEGPRIAVAALGDMVRMIGDDDTGVAGYACEGATTQLSALSFAGERAE
jgi:hypothetical protein